MLEDPFRQDEIEKYGRPIPSRKFILSVLQTYELPLQEGEIAQALQLEEGEDRQALQKRLRAMERDGELVLTRQRRYVLPNRLQMVKGEVVGHRDGFGFLKSSGQERDYFLTFQEMKHCLDGDIILAQLLPSERRRRAQARLVRVLVPRDNFLIGQYVVTEGIGSVLPLNPRIPHEFFIPTGHDALPSQLVVMEMIQRPSHARQGVGKITEILGSPQDPGLEIALAVRNFALPHVWPEAVLQAAQQLPKQVEPARERVDLRHLPLVTIDDIHAKDFDDAVYCESLGDAWTLWVAIADVSHYVGTASEMDAEAQKRGTSIYFPRTVIPMLPEQLSTHLCSLLPHQDRFSVVCRLTFDAQGQTTDFEFLEAVMRSHARLTYDEVNEALCGKRKIVTPEGVDLTADLQRLHAFYKKRQAFRVEEGALHFENEEAIFHFDAMGAIENITPRPRHDAHKVIEECMVAANVAAATFLSERKSGTLYRVHDKPTMEKMTELRSSLKAFGVCELKGSHPTDYGSLFKAVCTLPNAPLLHTLFLRAMSAARYTTKNGGHFGLALPRYTHFTSPIRRYPDLVVHRLIKEQLHPAKRKRIYSRTLLQQIAEQCSLTERRADEASRSAIDWLKCRYMQGHVGEVLQGVITSVSSFGFFVRLQDIFIEGLVHVSSLPNDYYEVDMSGQKLQAKATSLCYRLGDLVTVQVVGVRLEALKIELQLQPSGISAPEVLPNPRRKKRRTR